MAILDLQGLQEEQPHGGNSGASKDCKSGFSLLLC
jgi:Lanthionine-containing peptide SapB precursor RamS